MTGCFGGAVFGDDWREGRTRTASGPGFESRHLHVGTGFVASGNRRTPTDMDRHPAPRLRSPIWQRRRLEGAVSASSNLVEGTRGVNRAKKGCPCVGDDYPPEDWIMMGEHKSWPLRFLWHPSPALRLHCRHSSGGQSSFLVRRGSGVRILLSARLVGVGVSSPTSLCRRNVRLRRDWSLGPLESRVEGRRKR